MSAAPFVPSTKSLRRLAQAAKTCRGCPLYRKATQTVFGEGSRGAAIMLIGEQPGDKEDLAGRPFVGPAGHLLDKALEEAGIPLPAVYKTNAVKHFKYHPVGKRRLHQKPRDGEISACRPWLEAEITSLQPGIIVCLGVTAARSVLRRSITLKNERGILQNSEWGIRAVVTSHPSAILRAPDPTARRIAFQALVSDLRLVAGAVRSATAA